MRRGLTFMGVDTSKTMLHTTVTRRLVGARQNDRKTNAERDQVPFPASGTIFPTKFHQAPLPPQGFLCQEPRRARVP